MFDWIVSYIKLVLSVWKAVFTTIGMVFSEVWNGIKIAFDIVWGLITAAISIGVDIWKAIFETIGMVFSEIWDGIKIAFDIVWGLITDAISIGVSIWTGIFETIGMVFSSVWDGIKTAVEIGVSAVKKVIDGLVGIFTTVFDKIKDIVGGVFDGLSDTFKDVINTVVGLLEDGLNFAIKGLNIILDGIDTAAGPWVNFGEVPEVNIPELARGGVVNSPLLAMIGEGGRPERVEPLDPDGLSKRDKAMITLLSGGKGGGITMNVYPSPGMNETELASKISRELAFQLRRGAA